MKRVHGTLMIIWPLTHVSVVRRKNNVDSEDRFPSVVTEEGGSSASHTEKK